MDMIKGDQKVIDIKEQKNTTKKQDFKKEDSDEDMIVEKE